MQQSAAIMVAGSTDLVMTCSRLPGMEVGADEKWAQYYILTELLKILETHSLSEVVLDKFGENATLIPLLEDAGITVIKLIPRICGIACVGVQDALINGRLKHRCIDANQPLDVAVLGAGKRFTNEQFVVVAGAVNYGHYNFAGWYCCVAGSPFYGFGGQRSIG